MYNHYLYDDRDAFENLYVDVSEEMKEAASPAASSPAEEPASAEIPPESTDTTKAQPVGQLHRGKKPGLAQGLGSILARFKSGDTSLISLLILAFLLLDAEDDERLIIIALAFLLGL